ncbi:MAG: FliM/FliN family flagellar motor switch protein [Campylobacterota bacterium]|nr:FliM/FliN family flagellar motor switch protein [Campylobacterota bacterium]
MASDISNIIKSEISNTLESLLSVSSKVDETSSIEVSDIIDEQCIKVESNFSFADLSSVWTYYIPTKTATKFEYLMLGGIADLKDTIDDETSDAVKEIVSTMCGSMTTSINAQGFEDISGIKFSLGQSSVIKSSEEKSEQLYSFKFSLNDEELYLYIAFDNVSVPYIELITGLTVDDTPAVETQTTPSNSAPSAASGSVLSSLLGEDSADNLRLLFDIKMRLSVRLGTKIALLKDVISWDIGEIIELTQMTNEPLDILVNGVVVGQGEAVIVDGKFGVKIKHLGESKLS